MDNPLVQVEESKEKSERNRTWIRFVSLFFLFISLLGVSSFLLKQNQPTKSVAQQVVKKEVIVPPSPILSRPTIRLDRPSESYEYGDMYMVEHADRLVIMMTASKPTGFKIRSGGPKGKILANKKFTPSVSEKFIDSEWISLRIDQPNLVHLFVNGIQIDTTQFKKAHLYQFKLKK